jgi:eukaryotic-like serine/threonine-protein kinase
MGSVGYMSPEQVRGLAVDHRSDIFSFGSVLYEMLTGKRAFRRDSGAETMTAILKDEPPELVPDTAHPVSPGLERILRHCLEKDPAGRFQSAHDLAFALQALSGSGSTASNVAVLRGPTTRRWLTIAAVAALAALVGAAAVAYLRPSSAPQTATHFSLDLKTPARHLSLSPDGKMLAFVAPDERTGRNVLFVHRIGEESTQQLPGTDGAGYPFWSPDGNQVAFFAGSFLKRIPTSGGVVATIAPALRARGGSWNSDGTILFAPNTGNFITRVPAAGGEPTHVTVPEASTEPSHRWPHFLPDGKHFIFLIPDFSRPRDGLGSLRLGSIDSKEYRRLVAADTNGYYVDPGYIVYGRGNKLNAIRFDPQRLEVIGSPFPIAENAQFIPTINWAEFAVSRNGTLVAVQSVAPQLSQLTWRDRSGKELGSLGPAQLQANPAISPDGSRVAVDATDLRSFNIDVYVFDLHSGTQQRATFTPGEDVHAAWFPDGKSFLHRSFIDKITIQRAFVESTAAPIVVTDFQPLHGALVNDELPEAVLPGNGGYLLTHFDQTGSAINRATFDGKIEPFLPSTTDSVCCAVLSPNGRWVAYTSDESGDNEIYVTTFPAATGKWQVTRSGGNEPRWSRDGKELFFLQTGNQIMAVPVLSGETFRIGTPTPLFVARAREPISSTDEMTYDVTPDGKRFLVNEPIKNANAPPIHVVFNLQSMLKEK